jgi:hypothetical protein
MDSFKGLTFGIVNIVGNFGTVFVDQSYWQSAIAVKPEVAASGYILGGVVWFAVPMMMGSTHGLVGRALTTDFTLQNGASHITEADSGSGLTPARVAVEMLGVPGAWILLIMLFMAIVSTGCAEIIAVATIMTYDVYCEYLNPELKGTRMQKRQIFYATILDIDATLEEGNEDKELVTVKELAKKSSDTVPVDKLPELLTTLGPKLLPNGRQFKTKESTDVQSVLAAYTENSSVTYELLYFALQSQVLCKLNREADVMLRVMKFFCCVFAVFMGFLAVFLQTLLAPHGLGLGFVYMSMGIFVGPAVAPAAMAILMQSASKTWCTGGAIIGLIGSISTWFLSAMYVYEEYPPSLSALGGDVPFVLANIVAICLSGVVAILGSVADPDKTFEWADLGVQLPLVDDMPPPIEAGRTAEGLDKLLVSWFWKSVFSANFLFLFLCLLFPGALYLMGTIFGSTGFTIWIGVFAVWCFVGGLIVIILPILDFKKDVARAAELNKEKQAAEAAAGKVVPAGA